uniref:Uncharacterized protein n=1 Tax=Amphimedon queenslandica TaxID=400682 RepID=A0A1X7VDA9_AMPQE
MKFWKAGARKLYAVKEADIKAHRPMSSSLSIVIDSDDSDDFELLPYTKKLKSTSNKGNEMDLIIGNEIKGIRSDLNFVNKLKQEDKVPVALKKLLHDSFTCHI